MIHFEWIPVTGFQSNLRAFPGWSKQNWPIIVRASFQAQKGVCARCAANSTLKPHCHEVWNWRVSVRQRFTLISAVRPCIRLSASERLPEHTGDASCTVCNDPRFTFPVAP